MRVVGAATRAAVGLVLIALAVNPVSATIQRFCIQDDRIAAGLSPFAGNFCTANDLTFVLISLGIQQDGCVEWRTQLVEQLLEVHRLLHGAWKSVEDEAVSSVGLREPLADNTQDDVVGDQLAGPEDGPGLLAETRPQGDGLPQHVAGGDLRNIPVRHQLLGLRAFAATRRAQQYDAHLDFPIAPEGEVRYRL